MTDVLGNWSSPPRRPILSREEEAELADLIRLGREAQARIDADQARAGDEEAAARGRRARHRFIESNIGLTVQMASKMKVPAHVDRRDLLQDALLGVERALEDFDHTRGWKFSTYASWWIRRSMQQGLEQLVAPVRIPSHQRQQVHAHRAAAAAATAPTPGAVDPASLDTPLTRAARQALTMSQMASLDQPLTAESGSTLGDQVPSETLSPESAVERELDHATVAQLLALLDDDNAELVRARYGLDGQAPVSLVDLAAQRGVSPEAVRRRIVRALRRLRPEAERLASPQAA